MAPALGYSLDISMIEFASCRGSGLKTTESTIANNTVFAPMQTANVSSTVSANPLARQSDRAANFRSRKSASMMNGSYFGETECRQTSHLWPLAMQYV